MVAAARQAFLDGTTTALLVAAAVLVVTAVVAAIVGPRHVRAEAESPAAAAVAVPD